MTMTHRIPNSEDNFHADEFNEGQTREDEAQEGQPQTDDLRSQNGQDNDNVSGASFSQPEDSIDDDDEGNDGGFNEDALDFAARSADASRFDPLRDTSWPTPMPVIEKPAPSATKRTDEDSSSWGSVMAFVGNLPGTNQMLLFGGLALIGWGMFASAAPPVADGVQTAVRPYTATGKEENCASHLKAVGLALAMYRRDNDERFPAMDYTLAGKSGKDEKANADSKQRVTWVSVLGQYSNTAENFVCPLGNSAEKGITSSYGLNAALASGAWGSVVESELDNPSATLTLADRSEEHDLALLPPFAGWTSSTTQSKSRDGAMTTEASATDVNAVETSNLDFRHSDKTMLLYVDGHVSARSRSEEWNDSALWGGKPLFLQATERLKVTHPILGQVGQALQDKKEATAVQLLRSHKAKGRAGLKEVLALWQQNGGTDGRTKIVAKDVDTWGWRLAGLWAATGEREMLSELNRLQSLRSQSEWDKVRQGGWQTHESDQGFRIEVPANWSVQTEPNGRYTNTFFRSDSPYVTLMVEKGDRSTPGTERGIDWDGMESDYRKRYGARYKRIRRDAVMLAGEAANLWEYEIERKGEPRLRKLYIGRSHTWNSYVLACTAPTEDYKKGVEFFNKAVESFRYR
jgi:prepilin-type processing-associated H-X9-DG protein